MAGAGEGSSISRNPREFKLDEYAKGAVLGQGGAHDEDEEEQESVAKFVRLGEDEVGAEDFGLQSVSVKEGDRGNEIQFVIPEDD
jgi:hypothetical protein